MFIVGIIPIAIIVMIALHLTIKAPIVRMIVLIGASVGTVAMGYQSYFIIGIVLVCLEIIINKIMGVKFFK